MEEIKDRFGEKASVAATEIKEMLKIHGEKKIGEITLAQVYQGMRGMTGLVTETSLLDAQEVFVSEGTLFQNYKQNYQKYKVATSHYQRDYFT